MLRCAVFVVRSRRASFHLREAHVIGKVGILIVIKVILTEDWGLPVGPAGTRLGA
jgi:hypothetical protein